MERYTYSEQSSMYYKLHGDDYYPCVTMREKLSIGNWGARRHRYLREHKKALYVGLFLSDKLEAHIKEIDQQAELMFFRLINQLKTTYGVTEQLKEDNQGEWIQKMNSIYAQATEMVNDELIFR